MTNSRGRYLGDDRFAPLLAELDRRAAVVLLHPASTGHHEVIDLGRPRPMLEFLFDTARTDRTAYPAAAPNGGSGTSSVTSASDGV